MKLLENKVVIITGAARVISVYKNNNIPVRGVSFLNYSVVALFLIALFYFGRNAGANEILLLATGSGIGALGMFAALYGIRKKFRLLH